MLTSHSLMISNLKNLRTGTDQVPLNLSRGGSFWGFTDRHRRIVQLRQLVLDTNERLQREIDDELHDNIPCCDTSRPEDCGDGGCPERRRFAADPFGCGLLYGPVEDEHPVGVGACVAEACDVAIHAAANTSLDRRPA